MSAFVQMLEKVKEVGETVHAPGDAVLVRHHRFRNAALEECPAVSIRFITDEPFRVISNQEIMRRLTIELIAEGVIPVEEVSDPTGFATLTGMLDPFVDALVDTFVGRYAHSCEPVGDEADDDSTSDTAGLSRRLLIDYRVSRQQPSLLLT